VLVILQYNGDNGGGGAMGRQTKKGGVGCGSLYCTECAPASIEPDLGPG